MTYDKVKRRRGDGTRHGMMGTPEYRSWISMRSRCSNPKDPSYPRYGGVGITVSERWDSFLAFYADMGQRPEGTSLDRIDNKGNYEPGNCRWATNAEQHRNRSDNRTITFSGKSMLVVDWASHLGMSMGTLSARLSKWPVERALGEPLHMEKKRT